MPLKMKYFVRTNKRKPENEVNIRVRLSNGRKFDFSALTGFQVSAKFWNDEKGIYRQRIEFRDYEENVRRLSLLSQTIEFEYYNLSNKESVNTDWLKKVIDKFHSPDKYSEDKGTLFDFIQNFTENSDKRINPNTGNVVCYKMRREYIVTFRYLKEFAETNGEVDFDDIDMNFYNNFSNFLRNQGLSVNTIGKKIQTLKIFLNAATEEGKNNNFKYKSRKFRTVEEEVDNIYLTKEEIKKFYDYDFSDNPRLEKVRDIFIVGCWTGLRFSDLSQVNKDNINGKILRIRQSKTGRIVNIPIHVQVWSIMKKYDMDLPKLISNQKFNSYLKEAAEIVELNSTFIKTETRYGKKTRKKYRKFEVIGTHTARRSFCTNAYKDNIPSLDIMAISGHKTEKAFLRYIKIDGEEHANRVLKFWQESGETI
jgi:integrase